MENQNKCKFNKKGAALMFVVIALLVAMIMIVTVAQLAQTNIRQASTQEKGIQAYYIARSGAELAYEALCAPPIARLSQIDTFGNSKLPTPNPTTISIGEGKANISLTTKLDSNNKRKIVITSVGTLNQSQISNTVKLEMFADSTMTEVIWSK